MCIAHVYYTCAEACPHRQVVAQPRWNRRASSPALITPQALPLDLSVHNVGQDVGLLRLLAEQVRQHLPPKKRRGKAGTPRLTWGLQKAVGFQACLAGHFRSLPPPSLIVLGPQRKLVQGATAKRGGQRQLQQTVNKTKIGDRLLFANPPSSKTSD